MKNIVVYNPARYNNEIWLPAFWSQAKTYYEKHGTKKQQWYWTPCTADLHSDNFEKITSILEQAEPDVFAISLYVWNYKLAHQVAKWVKQRWPKCFVISGGPHQYFKHDLNWFNNHPYLDASLPGECYGELCLQQILDKIDNHGQVDFDEITDLCYPAGKNKLPTHSKKRSTIIDKKSFDYNWSSFAKQKDHIDQLVSYARENIPDCKVLAIVETTRGCPYGCVYCDWGGGINTSVIKKESEVIKQDLELLCSYELAYLYIADANFGIFGQRDIEIMQTLVDLRKRYQSDMKIGYGGFAKTPNKLEHIRKILELDIKNQLSNSQQIKISMQSLDDQVLKNIDRKNIDLEQQVDAFLPLAKSKKIPIYVEMILGLPGMTLNKFYHELDILGQNNLSAMWYEWLMLPETPAYDPAYREQYGIDIITKTHGWAWADPLSKMDIVIQTNSYSRKDYLEMLVATSVYHVLIHGGLFASSIEWIKKNHAITIGRLIKDLYRDLLDSSILQAQWREIVTDTEKNCFFDINGHQVFGGQYFLGLLCFDQNFVYKVATWLKNTYECPDKKIKKDLADKIDHWDYNQLLTKFLLYSQPGKLLVKKSQNLWSKLNIL